MYSEVPSALDLLDHNYDFNVIMNE